MYSNLRELKAQIRERHKQLRSAISPIEKSRRDNAIAEHFLSTMAYEQANQILCYASLPIEVSTTRIVSHAFMAEKRCLYPRCMEHGIMQFHYVQSFAEITPSYMGIYEPAESLPMYIAQNNDICIVPALSYDSEGYRMGYGSRYYDRFLADFHGVKIGICYKENIEKKLPRGRYDMQVDILITEDGLFRLK